MGASSKTLEITVISGQFLHVDQKPVTENTYVTVRTESIKCCKTSMAMEGKGHPSWNEKFLLDIPMHARSITFEVQCKMSTGVVKSVGVARIALSDFLGGSVPESSLQLLSYGLRNWDGRRSGVVNFSVRVKTPEEDLSKEIMKEEKEMVVDSGSVLSNKGKRTIYDAGLFGLIGEDDDEGFVHVMQEMVLVMKRAKPQDEKEVLEDLQGLLMGMMIESEHIGNSSTCPRKKTRFTL